MNQYLKPRSGSILIVALWMLFLLGALGAAINAYIQPQMNFAGKLKNRLVMHYLAVSGVKKAVLEIKDDETELYDALNDKWSSNDAVFKEVALGDGMFSVIAGEGHSAPPEAGPPLAEESESQEVRYGVIDEERKININKVPYEVFRDFLMTVGGVDKQDAESIADSVIDWRDEDDVPQQNGAEDGYYSMMEKGYPCKNADFEVLEELLLVKGMTQDIFDKIKDRVTAHSSGAININTADETVLMSLGMSSDLVSKIMHFRKGSDGVEGTGDDNVFSNVETIQYDLNSAEHLLGSETASLSKIFSMGLLSVRSDNFMGQAVGQLNNRSDSAKITFVFNRDSGSLSYWREE